LPAHHRQKGIRLMAFLRALARSTSLSFLGGFSRWRWALLTALFALAAGLVVDTLQYFFTLRKITRPVDVWDIFPTLLRHTYVLHFLFAFGFLLLVGDHYHRQRDQGTAALFAIRMPSRRLYWLGNMGAIGIMAGLFIGVCWLMSLLVGFIMVPPPSLWPMLPRENPSFLNVSVHMPAPIYSLLVAAYTAWGLWIGGSAILLVSTFFRNTAVVLGAIAAWVLASLSASWYGESFTMRFLCIGELIGHHKHRGEHPMSLGTFFAGSATMLVLIAVIGSWRMRREEI
jgi:hypothetical protein